MISFGDEKDEENEDGNLRQGCVLLQSDHYHRDELHWIKKQ